MGAGQRKLLLVLGMEPIILLQTFGDRRWTAQAIIGIGNSTHGTFGCEVLEQALDSASYYWCWEWHQQYFWMQSLRTGA